MMPEHKEKYLGDGLYASFDGFGITLRAPRIGGDHYVYLEAPVLDAFERYVAELQTQAEERAKAVLTSIKES
jgi:hypothetical protein